VNRGRLDAAKGEYIMNLSEDGAFVQMLKPPRRNERVSIEMNINGRAVHAEAVVLHSHRSGEGLVRDPGMAVRFTTITPEDREAIRKFVHDEVTRGISALQA